MKFAFDGQAWSPTETLQVLPAEANAKLGYSVTLDDQEVIHDSPLLAYVAPGRFAEVDRSNAFPFPAHMKK